MFKTICLKKGLDIPLKGGADKYIVSAPLSKIHALKPEDFHHIIPKLEVKIGDEVKSGSVLFRSKKDARITFCSPVSGEIVEIKRGAQRKILEIKILTDSKLIFEGYESKNPGKMSAEEVKNWLLEKGAWPFIKQRPYDVIADPNKTPKSIFISTFSTVPLAPDFDYVLRDQEEEISTALKALQKLTKGNIYLGVHEKSDALLYKNIPNVVIHRFSGPHPTGNVGVQIAQIDPINKGDTVWVVAPQDLAIIGRLFLTGKWDPERIIALAGPQVKEACYIKTRIGALASDILRGRVLEGNNRYISGNVLNGSKVDHKEGYLGYYDDQFTVIPEGNDYDFLGWLLPRAKKFSVSRANMFSWLHPRKNYALNTNINGEERAFVMTGWYEKYFPFDIYPMQLLKAILTEDIDKMEQLGIYEVAPEDFALTEFVDVSKLEHQQIVRKGLDIMLKEVG